MKSGRFKFFGAMACGALMSLSTQAEQLYTIIHKNGVKEDVNIENFYPGGGPVIMAHRNQTTVLLSVADIVRMERLKPDESTFKVTFVTGDVEELQVVRDSRIEGKARVPDNPRGRWGSYCASVDAITSITRSKGG